MAKADLHENHWCNTTHTPGSSHVQCAIFAGAVIRLALDQLLWAPVFISTFLASLLTLEVCLSLLSLPHLDTIVGSLCILIMLSVKRHTVEHASSRALVVMLPSVCDENSTCVKQSACAVRWSPHLEHCCIQLSATQGKGHEVKSKLRNDLKPTVIANWKLWVPAQFINFRLVPPHLQVTSKTCCGNSPTLQMHQTSVAPCKA